MDNGQRLRFASGAMNRVFLFSRGDARTVTISAGRTFETADFAIGESQP
jgi:hypothetical protein